MFLLLFLATVFTTITLGAVFVVVTSTIDMTLLDSLLSWKTIRGVWGDPGMLRRGLSFALPALFILLCHEMGHYLACRRYKVDASLPYFIPAPLGLGTFGAFIRLRQRIYDRQTLFDIGVAGPLAGFLALLPFLILGTWWSEVVPDVTSPLLSRYVPGASLGTWLVQMAIHGALPVGSVLEPHPFLLAAWFGLFATALNLLPLSQLDGGHLLYAFDESLYHRLRWPLWGLLLIAGWWWAGWWLWGFILLVVLRLKHPPLANSERPLDPLRRRIALVALLVFVLSFMPVPLAFL